VAHNTADSHDLWKRFVDARFMLLTTVGAQGAPYSCPMTLQRAEGNTLWFFASDESPTASNLQQDSRIGAAVMDNDDSFYFAASGDGQLVRDRQEIDRLWNPMVAAWFPNGPEDPHVVLVRVELDRADYWDSASNKLVQFGAMVKAAVTGKPPTDPGDHGALDPAQASRGATREPQGA
jgi:general stress protein 26